MRRIGLCFVVAALVGCSGGEHSIFGATNPSGNLIVTMVGASTPLSTSVQSPQPVTNTGFSVTVHEDNYPSGFNANVVSYTSPTTVPCWVINVDQSHQPNIVTFTPANVPDPLHQGFSVCPTFGDVEGVRFVDQRGNSITHYFRTL
jgi:hypothetical protein